MFAQNVNSLGDLTGDDFDEIIISSPRNERYLHDLIAVPELGFSPHLESTSFQGSITVLPGGNYNLPSARDIDDDSGGAGSSLATALFSGQNVFGGGT